MASLITDNTGRLRLIWRLAIFLIGFFGVYVLLAVAFVLACLVFAVSTEIPVDKAAASLVGSFSGNFEFATHVPVLLAPAVVISILVVVCTRYLDRRSIRSIGLAKPEPRLSASVPVGLGLGIAPIMAVTLTLWASGALALETPHPSWQSVWLLPIMGAAAFQEEMACRGYLFRNFVESGRPILGLALSSTFFWLMHALNPDSWSSPIISVNLLGAGILLALAYRASGNIWFPTALHLGWNLAQGVLLGLPVSGMRVPSLIRLAPHPEASNLLTGGDFGLEGSILMTMAQFVMVMFFLWVIHKQRRSSLQQPPREHVSG